MDGSKSRFRAPSDNPYALHGFRNHQCLLWIFKYHRFEAIRQFVFIFHFAAAIRFLKFKRHRLQLDAQEVIGFWVDVITLMTAENYRAGKLRMLEFVMRTFTSGADSCESVSGGSDSRGLYPPILPDTSVAVWIASDMLVGW